jgi:hypothetical protein
VSWRKVGAVEVWVRVTRRDEAIEAEREWIERLHPTDNLVGVSPSDVPF